MREIAFVNGTVILPDRLLERGVVRCVGDRITYVGQSAKLPQRVEVVDAKGGYISPGFIDLHVHGGAGADFMDGTPQAVHQACGAHLRHGTTTIFPTSTTGTPEELHAFLHACTQVQQADVPGLPTIPGVHLYGPYFAPDKVGCHSQAGRRSPTPQEFKTYFATGLIRIATCAAELPGADAFYKAAQRAGCLITCGHSNASWSEMARAFKLGMRHVDHFWCAMSSVPALRQRLGTPMQGSMAEFVLMHPEMSTEVIADGQHLAPELLEFAFRMLGPGRLCLVTDCNRALDMPPGEYRFGPADTGSLFENTGAVGCTADGSLASSVQGMDHMVREILRSTTATLPEVVRMASLTPAERTGIDEDTGSLTVGKRADLLVLSPRLRVRQVYSRGVAADFKTLACASGDVYNC